MKQQRGADAFAQPVAQNQNAHDHRHCMAQLMPRLRQRPPPLRLGNRREQFIVAASGRKQRLQAFGKRLPQHFHGRVAGDALRRLVPEHHFAFPAQKTHALWKAVEGGFEQFRAIGHRSLFTAHEFPLQLARRTPE